MQKIVVIVGLTSSGKSDLGIYLAQKFNGEIVSADSRQVYRGLDFCSGKVTKEEITIVPHHLLDVANLGEQFTLFDFQKMAYDKIEEILSRRKIPFIVGGTGLYTRSIVEGYELSESKPDKSFREKLEKLPLEELLKLCEKKDISLPSEPTKRRLIRLLEISDKNPRQNKPRYEVLQLAIDFTREEICERIRLRLEKRMPSMIKEIQNLLDRGESKEFLKSLGLEAKFVTDYIDGKFLNYDDFFEKLFIAERQFAKRQKTWFLKEKNIIWLNPHEKLQENAEKLVKNFLKP